MYVWLAVYFGDLVKPDECEHCGAVTTDLHGHHETYDLPLEVEWVCRSRNHISLKAVDSPITKSDSRGALTGRGHWRAFISALVRS
jgi:hypothetical protein